MMLFINRIRERLVEIALEPLDAITNVAQLAVGLLAAAYLAAQIGSFGPEDDLSEFLILFYLVILLAGIAVVVLEVGSRCWGRWQTRRARERLYARLRSQGHTPERSAALVGIVRALASVYTWRQSLAMIRDAPADADIVAAVLRRMPAPERRAFPNLLVHIALGALFALALIGALELLILAFAPDDFRHEFPVYLPAKSWGTTALASFFLLFPLSGATFGVCRLIQIRQRNNLRRSLERCRDAGLNAGGAALLLAQTPALLSNDKKAAVALRAAT